MYLKHKIVALARYFGIDAFDGKKAQRQHHLDNNKRNNLVCIVAPKWQITVLCDIYQ